MRKFLLTPTSKVLKYAILLVLWEGAARLAGNPLIFPGIGPVFRAFLVICRDDRPVIFRTLRDLILSFSFSLLAALALSLCAVRSKSVRGLLSPIFSLVNATPSVILIILVMIWSDAALVPFTISAAVLIPILCGGFLDALDVNELEIGDICRVYRITGWQRIRFVDLPGIFHRFSAQFPATATLNLKLLVSAELLAQKSASIGGKIFFSKLYLETASIFAWIGVIFLLNQLLFSLFSVLFVRPLSSSAK